MLFRLNPTKTQCFRIKSYEHTCFLCLFALNPTIKHQFSGSNPQNPALFGCFPRRCIFEGDQPSEGLAPCRPEVIMEPWDGMGPWMNHSYQWEKDRILKWKKTIGKWCLMVVS